jgi:hypothetical protein
LVATLVGRLGIAARGELTPSPELMVCPPSSSRWTGMDKRDANSTRAATPSLAARTPKCPYSSGFSPQADGGTRTPDPIITRGSGVSLVGPRRVELP